MSGLVDYGRTLRLAFRPLALPLGALLAYDFLRRPSGTRFANWARAQEGMRTALTSWHAYWSGFTRISQ